MKVCRLPIAAHKVDALSRKRNCISAVQACKQASVRNFSKRSEVLSDLIFQVNTTKALDEVQQAANQCIEDKTAAAPTGECLAGNFYI